VVDPYEVPSQIPGYQWNLSVTNAQISAYLRERLGIANTGVSGFFVDRTTRMGNVRSVTVLGTNGRALLTRTGDNARTFVAGLLRYANPNANLSGYSFSLRFTISSGGRHLAAITTGSRTTTHINSALGTLHAIDGRGNVAPLPQAATVRLIDGRGRQHALPTQSGSTGIYTVNGRGHGHHVGMSQWGARAMADRGMTYQQILRHYFTGVTIVSA
jgi:stage II sporulation protein D